MERLTKKSILFGYGYGDGDESRKYNRNNCSDTSNIPEIINKLGQLEDILEKYDISSVEELEWELKKIEALKLVVKNLQDSNFLKRQELDKYHDIEQELGIDLITLFAVLKAKKVYHKKYGYYDNFSVDVIKAEIWFDNFEIKNGKPLHFEKLKDYRKTWALTKGELK